MNEYTVWYPALVLAGTLVGLFLKRDKIQLIPQPRRPRKEAVVEQEIQETQEWVRSMQDETQDSVELKIYRYKWESVRKNPLLAIGAGIKRLAITAKPHLDTEMRSISRYMKNRPRPVTQGKVLVPRRRR